ncbi:pyridoxal phosphate-dependent transferase [Zopfochytrium polystomum]|nr:pyridoxal phosphate-dependent transferase [Zopfochytrium polystomum]
MEDALAAALDRRAAVGLLRSIDHHHHHHDDRDDHDDSSRSTDAHDGDGFGDPLDDDSTAATTTTRMVDFSSNDYFGLARRPDVRNLFLKRLAAAAADADATNAADAARASGRTRASTMDTTATNAADATTTTPYLPAPVLGSTGSRLLTGNSRAAAALERRLARFHRAPAALLFNSGYDANLALMSTLPQPGGATVIDELVHASVHDGARRAREPRTVRAFRHNDVAHLRQVLAEEADRIVREAASYHSSSSNKQTKPSMPGIVVAVEAIYSMDGDAAPLPAIVAALADPRLTAAGGAVLVVDEAHSTGVCGPQGRGLVAHHGLEARVFARLHTFGKAVGAHGAAVLGPKVLKRFLVNYARPLVFSTAIPPHALVAVDCAYAAIERDAEGLQRRIGELVRAYRAAFAEERLNKFVGKRKHESPSSLTELQKKFKKTTTTTTTTTTTGNARVARVSAALRARGFDVRPIRSPTVPRGSERLRICLHAHNSEDEVAALADCLVDVLASFEEEEEAGGRGEDAAGMEVKAGAAGVVAAAGRGSGGDGGGGSGTGARVARL